MLLTHIHQKLERRKKFKKTHFEHFFKKKLLKWHFSTKYARRKLRLSAILVPNLKFSQQIFFRPFLNYLCEKEV